MANVRAELINDLLKELDAEEGTIEAAGAAYHVARARLLVSIRKYAAVRDLVTEQLGVSPYGQAAGVEWPPSEYFDTEDGPATQAWYREHGKYRFVEMKIGEAIAEVLKEARVVLTYEQIVERLTAGGWNYPEPVNYRSANAALMNTEHVAKHSSGYYHTEVVDADDLPFD